MSDNQNCGRKPVLQSLLVADQVYQDHLTGKYIVAGIFNSIQFAKLDEPREEKDNANCPDEIEKVPAGKSVLRNFPPWHKTGTPFVYLNLTEVSGEQAFSLRYVSLKDNKVYFNIDLKIACDDPLKNIDAAISIPQLPQEDGVFAVELLWHDRELLGSTRMTVQEVSSEVLGGQKL